MAPRTSPTRGAGLFGEPEPEAKPAAAWRANIDGGSRGNPGPASYGVVIRDPRGEIVARLKKYIGRTTNNVAEYYGLIAALDYAQSNNIRALRIESDSELMVKQMRGQYKVKSTDLKPLFERAKKMSQTFSAFRIDHVYREQNKEADALANEAMDEVSGKPPSENRNSKIESGNSKSEIRKSVPAANPTIKVRARFRSGILYPLEDINLPDGAEVEILLLPASKS
ncbi:MAG TPA: reverse transcriptase-like protein [Candidatus Acidoferrum sp.]|jgi:ribonuclease HI